MQEDNTEVNSKPSEKKSKNKKEKNKKGSFLGEHKAEFKKITWPTRKILFKQTITVICISLIVGVIIYGYDFVIDLALQELIAL